MEHLLAKMDANQANTEATLKELKVGLQHLKEEMLVKLDAYHKRTMARMNFQLAKMEACPEKTEATNFKANPEEIQVKAEHEEVPKEEAAVKTIRELKKRYGDQLLVIGCC
jgi:hypothetical protein